MSGFTTPAGPAGTNPLQIGPPASAPLHQNYSDLYAEGSIHPQWSPDYVSPTNVMTILANSVDRSTLWQQLNNNRYMVPMTWLGVFPNLTNPLGMGMVRVVHRLTVYSAPIGVAPKPAIHDHLYCLLDDLLPGNQIPHFMLLDAALDVTADLRVPTLDTLNANLNPTPTSFGPYLNNGQDSETVPTRSLCWIPPFVASKVIDSVDRTPSHVAALIGELVAPLGWDKLPTSLLVWLRVMLMADAQGRSLVQIPNLVQASLDEGLVNFRWNLVSQDLPTLGSAAIHSRAQ